MARVRPRKRRETPISARRRGGADDLSRWAVALALALLVVRPLEARADPVLAEALFQAGREALAAGDVPAACPKLAESHRLDPAGGTALLLGICFERQGKLASAWAALEDALSFALREKNDERVESARRHLAIVGPKLVRVSLHVDAPQPRPNDLVVRRDGVVVPPSALDTPVPLDAGPHVLVAEAKGFARFEHTFVVPVASESVGADGNHREVRITLEALPESATAGPLAETRAPASGSAPPPAPSRAVPSVLPRASPWIVAGAGGVLLGVGTFFGLRASGRMEDVRVRCPRSPCADRGAETLRDDAGRDADRATITLAAGAVLAAGGLTWGFVRRDTGAALTVAGRF